MYPTKDLNKVVEISVLDETCEGGMLVGKMASEVAAMLEKPLGKTKPIARTGAPLPLLKLTATELEFARQLLEAQGYSVTIKPLNEGKIARITIYATGGTVFGLAAERVVEEFNLEGKTIASTGSLMVKVPSELLEKAKQMLQREGFTLDCQGRKDSRTVVDQTVKITELSQHIIVFGAGADSLAAAWDISVQKQGNQSILKLPKTRLEEVKAFLIEHEYIYQVRNAPS